MKGLLATFVRLQAESCKRVRQPARSSPLRRASRGAARAALALPARSPHLHSPHHHHTHTHHTTHSHSRTRHLHLLAQLLRPALACRSKVCGRSCCRASSLRRPSRGVRGDRGDGSGWHAPHPILLAHSLGRQRCDGPEWSHFRVLYPVAASATLEQLIVLPGLPPLHTAHA